MFLQWQQWVTSASANLYECGMQVLVQQLCIFTGGGAMLKNCFLTENLPHQIVLLCSLQLFQFPFVIQFYFRFMRIYNGHFRSIPAHQPNYTLKIHTSTHPCHTPLLTHFHLYSYPLFPRKEASTKVLHLCTSLISNTAFL